MQVQQTENTMENLKKLNAHVNANVSEADKYMSVYKPKVLIIEDDLDAVNLIERILININSDVEVSWLSSSEEAYYRLTKFKRENWTMPYDLIISDIFLDGEETGLDLYRKTNKLYPEIPFIATSGTSIAKYFESTNMNIPVFLPKPISLAEWKAVLGEFIKG